MDEGFWILVGFILLIMGGVISIAVMEHNDEASLKDHIFVTQVWERHDDLRPFIADRLYDGVLSNGDEEEIRKEVVERYAQEYRNDLLIPASLMPKDYAPVSVELPDPRVVED